MFLFKNTQHTDGFMETAGFMAESVEKIFHLAEQVCQVLPAVLCKSVAPRKCNNTVTL